MSHQLIYNYRDLYFLFLFITEVFFINLNSNLELSLIFISYIEEKNSTSKLELILYQSSIHI